jgi:putative exporter of polyketide antibiotics
MPANRIVALTSAVIVLLLGLLPVVADADWTTTAGVIAAIVGLLGVVLKWLDGWQKWEERQDLAPAQPVADQATLVHGPLGE